MRQHLLGFAAQKHGCKALTAVACHEDAVAVVLFAGIDDGLGRRKALDGDDFAGHLRFIKDVARIGQSIT